MIRCSKFPITQHPLYFLWTHSRASFFAYWGMSAIAVKPMTPIITTDVRMPIIENTIAINPVKICPWHTPMKPKMNAKGDRMKDSAKMPTKPVITPQSPNFVFCLMTIFWTGTFSPMRFASPFWVKSIPQTRTPSRTSHKDGNRQAEFCGKFSYLESLGCNGVWENPNMKHYLVGLWCR